MKEGEKMASRIRGWRRVAFQGLAILTAAPAFLTGCAVGPAYIRPQVPEIKEWIEKDETRIKNEPAHLGTWWKDFKDPVLDELIDTAYRQNLDLRMAGIRILEARAQLGIAAGNQYPQLQQLKGNYTVSGLSENTANTSSAMDTRYAAAGIGFDAKWEVDFWGRFRRAVESGVWNLDASIAGYNDILVTLTAEVARIYVVVRTLEARLALAHENVRMQDRSLQITRVRFEGGEVTELDLAQARPRIFSRPPGVRFCSIWWPPTRRWGAAGKAGWGRILCRRRPKRRWRTERTGETC